MELPTIATVCLALSKSGFTATKAIVLLQAREGVYMGDVAKVINTTATAVTNCVELLEEEGLVKRAHDNRTDRRKVKVVITYKGEMALSHIANLATEIENQP